MNFVSKKQFDEKLKQVGSHETQEIGRVTQFINSDGLVFGIRRNYPTPPNKKFKMDVETSEVVCHFS